MEFDEIYEKENVRYDRLVSHEDCYGNLIETIEELNKSKGIVVEFGAGTGRVTEIIRRTADKVLSFDNSDHMLELARKKKDMLNWDNVEFARADNSGLPVENGTADTSVAGWTFCHIISFNESDWIVPMREVLSEMDRITKTGGTQIIVESLGSGVENPAPPNNDLKIFYSMLTEEYGFEEHTISTDYQFESIEEMHEVLDFFFPQELFYKQQGGRIIVPEFTAVFHKKR